MTQIIKASVLGSGTSAGVPVLGCDCDVCSSDDPRNKRTRASVILKTSSGKDILIDTAPELRLQAIDYGLKKLDYLLLTHTHADHTAGFDDLRALNFYSDKSLPVFIADIHKKDIEDRFYYHFVDSGYKGVTASIDLHEFDQGEVLELEKGLQVETFSLDHGHVKTTAFKFGRFMYATDFKNFSDELIARLNGQIDVMFASGIHFGSHGAHSTVPETIELFKKLNVNRGYITHLSHKIEYLRDSKNLPENISFSYDGMSIDLC